MSQALMKLTADNPYLDEVGSWCGDALLSKREPYVLRYSWAIPNQPALDLLATYGPLIEIGAGLGYWASLLRQMGVDILAYDYALGLDNHYCGNIPPWTEVQLGGIEQIFRCPTERTLFLCWPVYDEPMAHQCLQAYKGEFFCYVGEEEGGCTGDDDFFKLLHEQFEYVEGVDIPQWSGMHDDLSVWRRK